MVQSGLKPVSKARPCPVCGGDHKCSTTADGLICCGRTDQPVDGFRHLGPAPADPTWHLFRRAEDDGRDAGSRPAMATRAFRLPKPVTELRYPSFGQLTDDFARHLADNPDRRAELARRLDLPESVLGRVEVGWTADTNAWTFPERDGVGVIVGIATRFPDGTKRAIPGSRRGLTLVGGWADEPGPIFIVEGPSDALALASVGVTAVGRPSALGGADDLAVLLRDHRPTRPIVVVGENDRKESGLWPGRDGARSVADRIATALRRDVLWAMPPDQYKDVRAWVVDRCRARATGTGSSVAATDPQHPDYDPDAVPDPVTPDRDRVGDDIARQLVAAGTAIRAARVPGPTRRFPVAVPVTRLQRPGPNGVAWVWDGFLARDAVTLLSALPKCGKTTLLSHLLAGLAGGGEFCGRALAPGRAVVVSEEPEGVWAERAHALGLTDAIRVLPRGSVVRGSADDWAGFLADLGEQVQADPADLIVFDTLANLWPVRDENSAAEVGAALAPLHRLTAGRAVLLVHHLRKSDGQEGTGSRGSGALAGFVDVIAELRRVRAGGSDPHGRRRVLTGYGRYDGIPGEWTVEWVPGPDGAGGRYEHRAEGGPGRSADAIQDAVVAMLADGRPWTRKDLWDGLPDELRKNQPRFLSVLEAECPRLWRKESRSGRGGGFVYLAPDV